MNPTDPRNGLPSADPRTGLSSAEVQRRRKAGLSNTSATPKTKSVFRILREHIVTLFNILNVAMAAVLFAVGSYKNMLFMGVVLANIGIGIFQELRAKFATDALSMVASAKVRAVRDGEKTEIPFEEIVCGDILHLTIGNQVPAGCTVLSGEAEVNESFITGEAEPIAKAAGDGLLPGSFLVAGECVCEAHTVGKENLIHKMERGSRTYRKKSSEIILSLKKIINIVTVLIIPYSFLFYWLQTSRGTAQVPAINGTIAAMVGMIPEGLVLLVSGVMALSVYRLSKRKVLVKELYSIESLARTDVLCLDKTGTLTDGRFVVREVRPVNGRTDAEIESVLSCFASHMAENGTIQALKERCKTPSEIPVRQVVPFSSARKYSMIVSDGAAYVLGAPEYVLRPDETKERELVSGLTSGYRVLALSFSNRPEESGAGLPDDRTLAALVLITESLRPNAPETISYFQSQDVTVKVISGDNPVTVSAIAGAVGIRNAEQYIDLSAVPPDADYLSIANEYTVFGRVSPLQKKQLIQGLRKSGHTVGMTGDGVNDVLALREADVSIAINDGSAAARNVADMIMLDSDYSSLPEVVLEGRNAINNLERSSSLFLIKTIYAVVLGILFLFLPFPYPFVPIQITLINGLTVALPSLVLSLMRSRGRIRGNFLRNAFLKSLPIGCSVIAAVLFLCGYGAASGIPDASVSMFCALSVAACTVFGVFWVSRPMNKIKWILLSVVTAAYTGAVLLFGKFFEMKGDWAYLSPPFVLALLLAGGVISVLALCIHFYGLFRMERISTRAGKAIGGFFRTLQTHRIGSCSADAAFFVLLSFVPFMILLFSLTTYFAVSADDLLESLSNFFPAIIGSFYETLIRDVLRNAQAVMTPLSAFIVLWAASRAVYAIIRGMNSIYEIEETRPVFKVRGLSIAYTLGLLFVLLLTLILMVFSRSLSDMLAGLSPGLSRVLDVLSRFRVLFGIVYLSLFFCFSYLVLPNRKSRFVEQIPGALFAAAGWAVFSVLFAYYVNHFGNYANIYGSLTAVVVFMLWLYGCLYILFLGAEFNLFAKRRIRRWIMQSKFRKTKHNSFRPDSPKSS